MLPEVQGATAFWGLSGCRRGWRLLRAVELQGSGLHNLRLMYRHHAHGTSYTVYILSKAKASSPLADAKTMP